MAPPGVNSILDPLDIMSFSSFHLPLSAPFKSSTKLSASLTAFPTKDSLSESSSALSSVYFDHDYVVKTHMSNAGYRTVSERCQHFSERVDYENGSNGDAMLSSCAVDCERVTEEGTDTDFLKDLDDMNFSLDGLDPCCEVAMEDSFQDFIDSALEQSYSSFLSETSSGNHIQTHGQDAVILNKEQFLSILNLVPTKEQNSDELWSTSAASVPSSSSFKSNSSSDRATSDMNRHTSSNLCAQGTPSYDLIPTRQCSCIEFESVFKAVYSTAHPPYQECVRTCPSTLVTNSTGGDKNNGCADCLQIKTPEILMSPLFVDTSSSELSKSFQPSPQYSLDTMVEEDSPWRVDKDTADIMRWLSESQQEDLHQFTDSNNNVLSPVRDKETSTFPETSSQSSVIASHLDLESFIDLDNFDTDTTDNNDSQQIDIEYTFQGSTDQSKSNNRRMPCISQLKLSLLTERLGDRNTFMQGSYSNVYCESSLPEKLSPKSSDLLYRNFSPAWSRTDSIQSSVSPLPLERMDLSLSSEDDIDETLVKGPFALLNLFSDENATSLLHTDSTVPNIRFM